MAVLKARASAWQVVGYQLVAAKRFWRSLLIVGIGTPLLYVLALGIGLGVVINRHGNSLGVPYLQFVAPAFLTGAAVQVAASAAAFPVTSGFKWQRTFHGMAATPLTPQQICDGQLLWITLRLLLNSAIYLAIMASFGGARTGWVVLAVPVATFTGIAFAAPVSAVAAWVERENNLFNMLFRFVVTPMFLFSGTFYPISQLPRWGQVIAWFSPLWHGTELSRDAGLGGGLSALAIAGHLAYLAVWLVTGLALARWRFRIRLTK
jgi:lipooligosaccharide transport system permease protein